MNKKGQALVEFIIVVPVFIMLLIATLDYVRIMQNKSNLELTLENLISDESYALSSEYEFVIESKENYKIYILSNKVDIYSPFLTPVLGQEHKVLIKRIIYE